MKKIGIVTFHQALNYGAKLQAYALQQFLEKNGIENDVIDYTCHFMYTRNIRPIRVGKHHKLKSFIRSLITMRQVGIDRKKSVTFRNEFLNLSRPFDAKNIGEASNEYAAFIAGSDQVWSPICVGFDTVYLLDFAKPKQKYSYAASFAVDKLPADKELVIPGDTLTFKVKLLAPIAMEQGLNFAIREGGKTVGAGVVTKIVK